MRFKTLHGSWDQRPNFLKTTEVRFCSGKTAAGPPPLFGSNKLLSLDQAHMNCEEEKHEVCLYFQVDDSLERASQPHTKELKSVIGEMRACCR